PLQTLDVSLSGRQQPRAELEPVEAALPPQAGSVSTVAATVVTRRRYGFSGQSGLALRADAAIATARSHAAHAAPGPVEPWRDRRGHGPDRKQRRRPLAPHQALDRR